MLDFLHYGLMAYALVYLITQAVIFAVPRLLISRGGPLFEAGVYCPACVGFWVGMCLGVGGWLPFETPHPWYLEAVDSGFVAMALCHIVSVLLGGNSAWDAEAPLRGVSHGEQDE